MDVGKHEITIRIQDEFGFSNIHTHNLSVFNNPCHQCNDKPTDSPADTTNNQIK